MPKLHDQIVPEHLLSYIRAGALKADIIKEFRTNDRELAQLLQPLYRIGEMTREEFNNFFKGIPAKSPTAEQMEPPLMPSQANAREPASVPEETAEEGQAKPRGTISKFISGLWQVSGPPEKPGGPAPEEAAEPRELLSEASEAALASASNEVRVDQPHVKDEVDRVSAARPDVDRRAKRAAVAATGPGSPPARTGKPGISVVLKTILARLDSIDARLAKIEKKLDLH